MQTKHIIWGGSIIPALISIIGFLLDFLFPENLYALKSIGITTVYMLGFWLPISLWDMYHDKEPYHYIKLPTHL